MGADGKDSKKQGNSSSSGSPQGDLIMREFLLLCFHVSRFLSFFKRALVNRCKQLYGCGAKLVRIIDVIRSNHQRCLMWICIRFSTLFMCLVVCEVVWCLIIGCRILDLDRSIKIFNLFLCRLNWQSCGGRFWLHHLPKEEVQERGLMWPRVGIHVSG